MKRAAARAARGFTLIEMIAVLAIVALLASAAAPILALTARRAHEAELRSALRTLRQAIDDYKEASDRGLIEREADASGYPPTLAALVDGVPLAGRPRQRLYLLRRLPRDPFADPALAAAETWALRASDTPPDRPAPGRDVFDIASQSDAVTLDGTRYRDW